MISNDVKFVCFLITDDAINIMYDRKLSFRPVYNKLQMQYKLQIRT